jgi:ATP-dependent Clp protease protease subunit
MPPLPEYRENARRSVVIAGEIDDALVESLTAPICRLRSESSDPITVYINSPGGFIQNAEQIRHLLKAPTQEGEVCRTITVATAKADSAAAGLLALGDYAIAYPNARVHCHGARLASREITSQRALDLAQSLKKMMTTLRYV